MVGRSFTPEVLALAARLGEPPELVDDTAYAVKVRAFAEKGIALDDAKALEAAGLAISAATTATELHCERAGISIDTTVPYKPSVAVGLRRRQ